MRPGQNASQIQYISADKIILATGGLSYPGTGSTGDGYKMASKLGHNVVKTKPSLVPLTVSEQSLWLCKELQGLSLKNVKVTVKDEDKTIFEDFGEMLFTHFGVSGPVVLTASSIMARYKDIDKKLKSNKIKMQIDLKPALDKEKLDSRILRDFGEENNKQFRNGLNKLLPKKLINPIIKLSDINPDKKINEISRQERQRLVDLLKCLEIHILRVRLHK